MSNIARTQIATLILFVFATGTPMLAETASERAPILPGAVHLGKGVIERDVEQKVPDTATPLVLYCGGGFRSALAADNLGKMGYTNVISMDGGIRVWREKGYPLTPG